ncbi:MAG TPA: hypothetical protein DCR21_00445 [Succinivibrionaceae bacterium]|nr:manganese efflux pump [Succinivibrio sp.]HAR79277.1 hypothetical protein [Succinivibrionaceae bacterium]
MSLTEILLTALALSVDASICSIIYGKRNFSEALRLRFALICSLTFGIFQFVMPLIGFYCGMKLMVLIEEYDHWIAFGLLSGVALNMLKESFGEEPQENVKRLGLLTVLILGIATSLDALAVGFSIGLIDSRIIYISGIIGVICFLCSFLCFYFGSLLSKLKYLDKTLNILGALTLIAIGIGILHEHGIF